jgi:hypothetical protein
MVVKLNEGGREDCQPFNLRRRLKVVTPASQNLYIASATAAASIPWAQRGKACFRLSDRLL